MVRATAWDSPIAELPGWHLMIFCARYWLLAQKASSHGTECLEITLHPPETRVPFHKFIGTAEQFNALASQASIALRISEFDKMK